MRKPVKLIAIGCSLWAMFLVAPAWAARSDEVDAALQKAKTWLYSKQHDGNWEIVGPRDMKDATNNLSGAQWGGLTALATYALLSAGENPTDPRLVDAIDFLKKAQITGTYALGCRCLVWLKLPPTPEIKAAAKRDAATLLAMVKTQGSARGFYDYAATGDKNPSYSHSRSQYAVLGLWAAAQVGADIPENYWKMVEEGWISHQDASGGWTYKAVKETDIPLTPGMTAVGVATLFITQDFLHASEGIQPRGNITNPAIDKGLAWMAAHMDGVARAAKGERDFPHTTLYAVERIGVASGYKYLGNVDWYQKGSDWLVKTQQANGSWMGDKNALIDGVPTTSFGMLFLSRGRAPVMINKLQYDLVDAKGGKKPGPWNQRPRDAAHLTRWVGEKIERDLNWQIVNLHVPPEEQADAPILYISGSSSLNLAAEDKAKLKQYVEEGGLILGNPDGGKQIFTDSFKALGEELFPGYKFEELPEKHPIYTNQQFPRLRWKTKMPVLALSNGARVLMIIVPSVGGDLARQWQLINDKKREDTFQLPADIFLYAVDRQNLQFKGERTVVKADMTKATQKTITVARLQYDGSWNPEPAGWRQLAAIMRNDNKVDLKVTPIKLGEGKLDKTYTVAHLTGTSAVKFTAAQQDELKKYVDQGGRLIIDAAGGQLAFSESIETELEKIFGPDAAKALESPLKPDAPFYQALGSVAVNPEYRSFVRIRSGALPKTLSLHGYEIKGKMAIIYSPEDMTVGLVGQPVDGIHGYSPKTATELMAGLLLNSVK